MGIADDTARRLEAVDAAASKFDGGRLRNLAGMMVTNREPAPAPERVLLDVAAMNWGELLAAYGAKARNFSTTPFDHEGRKFRLFPGGVTIWSGYPGAGKTTLLRQLVCHLLNGGQGVFFASLEEDPQDLLVRLVQVAAGTETPTADQAEWFGFAYGERLKVWGVIGIAKHKQIVAAIQRLAGEGIKHAVIDSLMCLDIDNDDFEAQRQFANLLAATARAHKIHVHLVAHPRKAISTDQAPDLNDVAGARELSGIADNVVFVRRKSGGDDGSNAVPMRVVIRKQRHGTGFLGDIDGVFRRDLRQIHLDEWGQAIRYLPPEAYR